MEGLAAIFAKAKLSDEICGNVVAWCREQEAAELAEVKECFEELAASCEMSGLPKKRFLKALNEALGDA